MTTTKTTQPGTVLWQPNKQIVPPLIKGYTWKGLTPLFFRVIFCIFCLGIQVYMVYRALYDTSGDFKRDQPIVYKSNIYLPIWNFVCFGGGIVPTLLIQAYYGKYTAPPFNYPWRVGKMWSSNQTVILRMHVIPAILWFLGSTFQVFTTHYSWTWHRVSGLVFVLPVFSIFDFTAMISCLDKLSPLGAHVMFMETSLAVGTFMYFAMGLYYIGIKDYMGHKICMTMLIITALGPGFFRVLRHFRELVSCRLFKAPQFTNYVDVRGTVHVKNFRDVESTYFSMAFMITDYYGYYVLNDYGVFANPKYATLGYFFVAMPVIFVALGALLRYCPAFTGYFCSLVKQPNGQKDFNWFFTLNYNFPVLRDAHASTD